MTPLDITSPLRDKKEQLNDRCRLVYASYTVVNIRMALWSLFQNNTTLFREASIEAVKKT